MSAYWMWWIAAAALIAAELLTGTFYLLAVGIAVACGGGAAWLGAPIPVQWLIAGALGVVPPARRRDEVPSGLLTEPLMFLSPKGERNMKESEVTMAATTRSRQLHRSSQPWIEHVPDAVA